MVELGFVMLALGYSAAVAQVFFSSRYCDSSVIHVVTDLPCLRGTMRKVSPGGGRCSISR